MKSFLQHLQERSLLAPMMLSAAIGAGTPPETSQSTTTTTTTEPAQEKKPKTVSAQQYATDNAARNGILQSGDLTLVGNLQNPTPWNEKFGEKPWYFGKAYLQPQAASAFKTMDDDYYKETGKRINLNSAYRSRQQQAMFGGKYDVAAQPGKSRHGLGLALDVQPGTPEFDWMKKRGSKYGWKWMNIKNDACHFGYCGNVEVPDKD